MFRAIQRNVAFFGGLAASGWLCAQAAPALTSIRGAVGPTIFNAQSPGKALVAVIGCLAGASLIAGLVGRMINAAVGLFVLGFGVFVLAGRTANIREIAFGETAASARSTLMVIAIETLLWAVIALGAVKLVFLIAGPLKDIEPRDRRRPPGAFTSADAWRSALAGLAVILAVWLLAASPMKGQMLGATFLGSMIAGLAGRLISPHVQPVLLFVSPIVFGAIGQLFGALVIRQPLEVAYVQQQIHALSQPMPIDYVAGALMGVSVGLGWARSFLHHEETPATARA